MATTKKKTTTRKRTTTTTRRKRTSGTQIIPGVNVTVSWKRLLGITKLKRWFTKQTGIPTTEAGLQRKIGQWVIGLFTGKDKKSSKKNRLAQEDPLPTEPSARTLPNDPFEGGQVEEMPPQGPTL